MRELSTDDFPRYFEAVHGHQPFDWQHELLDQVTTSKAWPNLIDLPTGAGKTSVIDVAVFSLALDASQPPRERWAPRRIALVVDRRIVVDQAAAHGRRIDAARHEIVDVVKERLSHLSGGDGPPLRHALLRGAIVRDEAWADRPDVPALLSSTVDQLGSRLLFRGYGISNLAAPIHAGLLASDTLIFLDEVHLSVPFAQTLARLRALDSTADRRWHTVHLSATPHSQQGSDVTRFPSSPLRSAEVASPLLRQRLRASKPARFEAIRLPAAKDWRRADGQFAQALATLASDSLGSRPASLLGVVVNRVDTARTVASLLDKGGIDVTLVTGRMRPCDRTTEVDAKLAGWSGDRRRDPDAVRHVLVSTQCIEAGADLDLDGLVTELAPIDALRQRFGRVDRRGELAAAGHPAHSIVVCRGEQPIDDDPVYGAALARTWEWLGTIAADGSVDFGIEGLPTPPDDAASTGCDAPHLSPIHLDSFAQTSPVPENDHVVARWLHGDTAPSHEVTIVWRNDIDADVIRRAIDDDSIRQGLAERLQFCPPVSTEGLAVPIAAARAWLTGAPGPPVADVDAAAGEAPEDRREVEPRPYLRWTPHGQTWPALPRSLQPGDTVVVPAEYGGIARHNWDPSSTTPVSDAATAQHRVVRRRAVARLTPGVWSTPDIATPSDPDEDVERLPIDIVRDYLERLDTSALSPDDAAVLRHLRATRRNRLRVTTAIGARRTIGPIGEERETDTWFLVSSLDPFTEDSAGLDLIETESDREVDVASFTAATSFLDDHLRGVGDVAAGMGSNLGLPVEVVEDLRLAGELHDLGKADPRFQLWLCDGDPVVMARHPRLLAKSTSTTANERSARLAARRASGYPHRQRHELQSLALVRSAPEVLAAATDPELVEYLVATHHGYCRPFAPVAIDDDPVEVRYTHDGIEMRASSDHGLASLGSGIDELFPLLGRRYGWYGLARLEAVFRLADRWRSSQEQKGLVDHD